MAQAPAGLSGSRNRFDGSLIVHSCMELNIPRYFLNTAAGPAPSLLPGKLLFAFDLQVRQLVLPHRPLVPRQTARFVAVILRLIAASFRCVSNSRIESVEDASSILTL